ALQTSRLPDGRPLDPARVALVEEPVASLGECPDSSARVAQLRAGDTRFEVHTTSVAPAFLVVSDAYYPGWKATSNGQPASILRTNYLLRGVWLPAGANVTVFEFRPWSFYAGAAGSLVALLVTGALLAWAVVVRRPPGPGVLSESKSARRRGL